MKHRVRLDLPFENESDAKTFMELVKPHIKKAGIINAGDMNEEAPFIDYEICKHDEKKKCIPIEHL